MNIQTLPKYLAYKFDGKLLKLFYLIILLIVITVFSIAYTGSDESLPVTIVIGVFSYFYFMFGASFLAVHYYKSKQLVHISSFPFLMPIFSTNFYWSIVNFLKQNSLSQFIAKIFRKIAYFVFIFIFYFFALTSVIFPMFLIYGNLQN